MLSDGTRCLLSFIQIQYPSKSVLCSLCHLSFSHLLCFYNVCSLLRIILPPISLCTHPGFLYSLERLNQSKRVQAHTCTCSSLAENHAAYCRLCPFSPLCLLTFILTSMDEASKIMFLCTIHPPAVTFTQIQHAAALSASNLCPPSIIPPRCRVVWQLAAEEPQARYTLSRFYSSLLGCSI